MIKNEMWESAVRSARDMAGVFEFDGDTGYFYLYRTSEEDGQKIKGSIHVVSGVPDFGQGDIGIRWTANEDAVGLFIRSELWAAFDSKTGAKFGGDYRPGSLPVIPSEVSHSFA
jgi:hypothetical protein